MKSIINIAQVYGRLFSEDRQIIPMEYKTVQKYLSTETCKTFICIYSKAVFVGGDCIPDTPLLSKRKHNSLIRIYK